MGLDNVNLESSGTIVPHLNQTAPDIKSTTSETSVNNHLNEDEDLKNSNAMEEATLKNSISPLSTAGTLHSNVIYI